MRIFYGSNDRKIDVTEICYNKLMNNNIITIPSDDCVRSNYFTDPDYGVLKKIFISDEKTNIFEHDVMIIINVITKEITTYSNQKLKNIQNKLKIKYGSFNEELPEQEMVARYLTGNEKVLEIGSNIGRNSLIIGYILNQNNNNNFVTMESDPNTINVLTENRDINNLNFHIENSALSKRKLIQKGWDTLPSDIVLQGYQSVKIISVEELNNKYNIVFDTLVLDCEGAFYYILMDMPEILKNINLILMENDYHNAQHYEYVNNKLKENNFKLNYSQCGGWGPCQSRFYEVWKK